MKPILIIPPNTIDAEGIKALNDNGICTVVATEPSKVKFLDPIPAMEGRTQPEQAAIVLGRKLLASRTYINAGHWQSIDRADVWRWYLEALTKGTSLDIDGTTQEQEERIIKEEREEELRKIAREEARAEWSRKKAEKAAARTAGKK